MPRKQTAAAPENHERWLVSYADFITLLFAFFVVMFASSQTDHKRAQQISDSVKKALSEDRVAAAVQAVLGGTVNDKGKGNAMLRGPGGASRGEQKSAPTVEPVEVPRVAELMPSLQLLTKDLKSEIESGKMQVHMEQRGLVISFTQAATFASGGAELTSGAIESMRKVAGPLAAIPNPIRLEGHTDSLPINTDRFHSNWELSAGRSIAMLEVLANQFHIPKRRMSIAGYGDAAPIDTNSTEEGRARNRRVDLVILNETGLAAEPGASPGRDRPSPTAPH
ncbi:MAG TPA: flagellar motor protein MotB [Bryobacteraceae bacterium]|jgi:chemotaxis protein MotB